jgi:hypothetical protein
MHVKHVAWFPNLLQQSTIQDTVCVFLKNQVGNRARRVHVHGPRSLFDASTGCVREPPKLRAVLYREIYLMDGYRYPSIWWINHPCEDAVKIICVYPHVQVHKRTTYKAFNSQDLSMWINYAWVTAFGYAWDYQFWIQVFFAGSIPSKPLAEEQSIVHILTVHVACRPV